MPGPKVAEKKPTGWHSPRPCYACGQVFPTLNHFGRHTQLNPACSPEKRFWARVDKSAGPGACWPWTGPRIYDGYGIVMSMGTRIAHRLAWRLTHGSYPAKPLQVLHKCDNPPCCNPAHLFTGTLKENMIDKAKKGRSGHKLTVEQARAIKAEWRKEPGQGRRGKTNAAELAAKYGVNKNTVWAIAGGRMWKHA